MGVLLHALMRASEVSWLCGGDCNRMLVESEKKGGNAFKVHEAKILRNAMEDCKFVDLGFVDMSSCG